MQNSAYSFGYSPCPNDTFIFYALAHGLVPSPLATDIFLADVEELNQRVLARETDVSKVSAHVLPHVLDDYVILRAGGALGRGCGPIVVSRDHDSMQSLRRHAMAIPGKNTTAHLLLQLQGQHVGEKRELVYDQILPAVQDGHVAGGLVIHEGRFTYQEHGLKKIMDLGAWWEAETGLPLPLGVIIMKRSLGMDAAKRMQESIHNSLLYALKNMEAAWPYIQQHAQELSKEVIQSHIETFVNDFSLDIGEEGGGALKELLVRALALEGGSLPDLPLFPA